MFWGHEINQTFLYHGELDATKDEFLLRSIIIINAQSWYAITWLGQTVIKVFF